MVWIYLCALIVVHYDETCEGYDAEVISGKSYDAKVIFGKCYSAEVISD